MRMRCSLRVMLCPDGLYASTFEPLLQPLRLIQHVQECQSLENEP